MLRANELRQQIRLLVEEWKTEVLSLRGLEPIRRDWQAGETVWIRFEKIIPAKVVESKGNRLLVDSAIGRVHVNPVQVFSSLEAAQKAEWVEDCCNRIVEPYSQRYGLCPAVDKKGIFRDE